MALEEFGLPLRCAQAQTWKLAIVVAVCGKSALIIGWLKGCTLLTLVEPGLRSELSILGVAQLLRHPVSFCIILPTSIMLPLACLQVSIRMIVGKVLGP